jgi:hypothetical protein
MGMDSTEPEPLGYATVKRSPGKTWLLVAGIAVICLVMMCCCGVTAIFVLFHEKSSPAPAGAGPGAPITAPAK